MINILRTIRKLKPSVEPGSIVESGDVMDLVVSSIVLFSGSNKIISTLTSFTFSVELFKIMPSIPVKPVGLSITVMFDIERFILSGNGGTDPTGPCDCA